MSVVLVTETTGNCSNQFLFILLILGGKAVGFRGENWASKGLSP